MDAFVAQGYEDKELQILNDCRLHLKATLLSHICTARGTAIEQRAWAGKSSLTVKNPPWIGTYNPRPDSRDLWRSALQQTFVQPNSTSHHLRTPLGKWLSPNDTHWRWWRHYYGSNSLFERHDDGSWHRWSHWVTHQGQPKFANPTPVAAHEVPPTSCLLYTSPSPRDA